MIRVMLVMTCLSLLSCKKPPTPAGLALTALLDQVARGHGLAVKGDLAAGSAPDFKSTGELVDGTVEVLPPLNIGVYDWSRSKITGDEVLPGGEHRVQAALDVCIRADEGNGCTRPDTYAYTALVKNEEGTWKVASAAYTVTNSVR